MGNSLGSGEPDSALVEPEVTPLLLAGGITSMVAGSGVLIGGLILHVGEKSGRLVIFPFAGRLTMLLGVGLLAVGAALAGRRAGLTLGIVMAVGGVALYAVGLAFVQQLGSRLYQAFGLLTTLVGLIVVYAIYGMKDVASDTEKPPPKADVDSLA